MPFKGQLKVSQFGALKLRFLTVLLRHKKTVALVPFWAFDVTCQVEYKLKVGHVINNETKYSPNSGNNEGEKEILFHN